MAKYSIEFRNDAVERVRQGMSQRKVCHDLGVSKSAISKWFVEAERRDQGLPPTRDVSPQKDAQIRDLMRRTQLLEQENEVLRRATAYLSQIYVASPK